MPGPRVGQGMTPHLSLLASERLLRLLHRLGHCLFGRGFSEQNLIEGFF